MKLKNNVIFFMLLSALAPISGMDYKEEGVPLLSVFVDDNPAQSESNTATCASCQETITQEGETSNAIKYPCKDSKVIHHICAKCMATALAEGRFYHSDHPTRMSCLICRQPYSQEILRSIPSEHIVPRVHQLALGSRQKHEVALRVAVEHEQESQQEQLQEAIGQARLANAHREATVIGAGITVVILSAITIYAIASNA